MPSGWASSHHRGVFTVDAAGLPALAHWFAPERPGPVIYGHIRSTGLGRCRVDDLRAPRAVLAELPSGNYAVRGAPTPLPADVIGLVEAPAAWEPALRATDPDVGVWQRVIQVLPEAAPSVAPLPSVRRLGPPDADALAGLDAALAWIHETWAGAGGLAASSLGHGAFDAGRLVAVAVPFFVGALHEDIGVVTEVSHRGSGLASACAAAVVADIRGRGHRPTWTTSPDNAGSLGVARRLGFTRHREDVLYAVRVPIPAD